MALSDPEATRQVGKAARKTIYLSWDDIANKAVGALRDADRAVQCEYEIESKKWSERSIFSS